MEEEDEGDCDDAEERKMEEKNDQIKQLARLIYATQ
jgi:hypothetical protein